MKENILDIKTVCECNRCLGGRTLHPQAAVINLENPDMKHGSVKFEFYAILLIEECADDCNCCGRRYYDFSYATMVFLAPGEIFKMSKEHILPDKGLLLVFHPDLLFRTTLNRHLADYTFFHYRKEEALHLSQREEATVRRYFDDIGGELRHDIDTHTATLVSHLIELLLDYCTRFYERQFITRENKNKAILSLLDRQLDSCIKSGGLSGGHFPTVEQCADLADLSPAYFCDLLRFETGKTLDEYVQLKRLDAAKRLLLKPDSTPASVARWLGFDSLPRFCRLFKQITGLNPGEYRLSQN